MTYRKSMAAQRDFVAFFRSPYPTLDRLYAQNGSVSWLGAGSLRFAVLLGPEANRFLFANSDLFSWQAAFAGLVPLAGEGALTVNDGAQHRRLRQLVQPAFTGRKVNDYLQVVQRHCEAVLGTWRPGTVVDLYQDFQKVLRRATIESLFGAGLLSRSADLVDHLQTIHRVVDQNALTRRLQRFGPPSWRRALSARRAVRELVDAEIALRRSEEAPEAPDVLGVLLASRGDDGSSLAEAEISDQLISLLEAGAETTSAAFGWAVYCALRDPDVWAQLADEVAGAAPVDGRLAGEQLGRLPALDRVVSETLRLYPPTVIGPRRAATEFHFAGHDFPAGTTLLYSPYVTHRLAEIWPDPLRFDPERWNPSADGYRRMGSHEFLPFGGGPHRCIGSAFAVMTVKAALATLVTHSTLTLASTDVRPTGLIGMRPRDGLDVRVERALW